MLNPFIQVMNI